MDQEILYPKYFLSPHELFPNGIFKVPVDDHGVAMRDYEGYLGLRKVYNSVIIAFYALSMYNLYYDTHDKVYLNKFLTNSDFLVRSLVDFGSHGIWQYTFPWIAPGYICKVPWASGMAQGLGLSVLSRAWLLTNNNNYIRNARKVLASFKLPISKGGVLKVDKQNFWWYDEYCCTKSANVLNGLLFALIGIYEFYDVTSDKQAKFLFEKGVKTVERYVDNFELNFFVFKWSKYDDAFLFYSGPKYHDWHIKQLIKLYELTWNKKFYKYAKRWFKYKVTYEVIANSKLFNFAWTFYTKFLKMLYVLLAYKFGEGGFESLEKSIEGYKET